MDSKSALTVIAAIDAMVKQFKEGFNQLVGLSIEEKVSIWNGALVDNGMPEFMASQNTSCIPPVISDEDRLIYLANILSAAKFTIEHCDAAFVDAVWIGVSGRVFVQFNLDHSGTVKTNDKQELTSSWDEVLATAIKWAATFYAEDKASSVPSFDKKSVMIGRLQDMGFEVKDGLFSEQGPNILLRGIWSYELSNQAIKVYFYTDDWADVFLNDENVSHGAWNEQAEAAKKLMEKIKAEDTKPAQRVDLAMNLKASSLMTDKLLEQGFAIKELTEKETKDQIIAIKGSWTNEATADKIYVVFYHKGDYATVHANYQLKAAGTWEQVSGIAINLVLASKAERILTDAEAITAEIKDRAKVYSDKAEALIAKLRGHGCIVHLLFRNGLVIKTRWHFAHNCPAIYLEFNESGGACAYLNEMLKPVVGTWDEVYDTAAKFINNFTYKPLY